MLKNDGTIYDVAKILGDTVETVEKHYAPFVKELRDRVRGILEKKPERRVRILSPTRHHNLHRKTNSLSFNKIKADGPVSRILCGTVFGSRWFSPEHAYHAAAIIPLGHDSHRDSSSLPEGSHPR
jgi:hypothetical protein